VNLTPERRVLHRVCSLTARPGGVTDTEGVCKKMDDNGSACPDGRLLALRCLGIPQVRTRAPMSRRRALRYRLAAFWARLRPGTAAELASVVLRLGEEIDLRERMLDAALSDAPSARQARLS